MSVSVFFFLGGGGGGIEWEKIFILLFKNYLKNFIFFTLYLKQNIYFTFKNKISLDEWCIPISLSNEQRLSISYLAEYYLHGTCCYQLQASITTSQNSIEWQQP